MAVGGRVAVAWAYLVEAVGDAEFRALPLYRGIRRAHTDMLVVRIGKSRGFHNEVGASV